MSKLEYLNPEEWSLHVIDGETDGVPEGWVLVPEGAEIYLKNPRGGCCFFAKNNGKTLDSFNTLLKNGWHTESTLSFESIHINYNLLWQRELKSEVVEDVVNSPSHYTSGGIECLDAMQAMLSRDEFIGFLRGNIFKYNWRYKMKNGIEDLKKAKFYQEKLIEVDGE